MRTTNIADRIQTPIISGAWLVLAGATLWGTTGTAQTLAPDGASPVAIGTMRLICGALALLIIAWRQGRLRSDQRWHKPALLIASGSMAAYQIFFFAGVDLTGVAIGTIVGIGSAPIMGGLLAWMIRGETLSKRWAIATGIAVVGCGLLILSGSEVGVDLAGVGLALCAGLSYAIYTVASKKLLEAHHSLTVTTVVFTLAAVMLTPLLLTVNLAWLGEAKGALVVLHLGVITVAFAYILFVRGLASVPVSTAVTLTLAEPLTAGILGVVVVGEDLTLPTFMGIGLLFGGLYILSMDGRARRIREIN
jgi:DME family drug/metabolite transporter